MVVSTSPSAVSAFVALAACCSNNWRVTSTMVAKDHLPPPAERCCGMKTFIGNVPHDTGKCLFLHSIVHPLHPSPDFTSKIFLMAIGRHHRRWVRFQFQIRKKVSSNEMRRTRALEGRTGVRPWPVCLEEQQPIRGGNALQYFLVCLLSFHVFF